MEGEGQSKRARYFQIQVWRKMCVSDPAGSPLEGWFPTLPSFALSEHRTRVVSVPSGTPFGFSDSSPMGKGLIVGMEISRLMESKPKRPRLHQWLLDHRSVVGGGPTRARLLGERLDLSSKEIQQLRDANASAWKIRWMQTKVNGGVFGWLIFERLRDVLILEKLFDLGHRLLGFF